MVKCRDFDSKQKQRSLLPARLPLETPIGKAQWAGSGKGEMSAEFQAIGENMQSKGEFGAERE